MQARASVRAWSKHPHPLIPPTSSGQAGLGGEVLEAPSNGCSQRRKEKSAVRAPCGVWGHKRELWPQRRARHDLLLQRHHLHGCYCHLRQRLINESVIRE